MLDTCRILTPRKICTISANRTIYLHFIKPYKQNELIVYKGNIFGNIDTIFIIFYEINNLLLNLLTRLNFNNLKYIP
jgi:hypothetical protein